MGDAGGRGGGDRAGLGGGGGNWQFRPVVQTREKIPSTILPEGDDRKAPMPAYWTPGRWGTPMSHQPDKRNKGSLPFETVGGPAKGRPSSAPVQKMTSKLPGLEAQMRATLGAMANYNTTERVLLLKMFRSVDVSMPRGMVTKSEFRQVWHRLGVRLEAADVEGLFRKFGQDLEGRMPYEVFTQALLESPSRVLAMEGVMRGCWKSPVKAEDAAFKGKIYYQLGSTTMRKGVYPPSYWDGSAVARSERKPGPGLSLEFVYGYGGKQNTAPNLFFTEDGRVAYYTAGVAVVYHRDRHEQQFFLGHDDDISCMAITPNRKLIATGQVAGLGETGNCPYVCVWDPSKLPAAVSVKSPNSSNAPVDPPPPSMMCRLDFPKLDPTDTSGYRLIRAVGFSGCGRRLACVTGDDNNTLHIFEDISSAGDWSRAVRVQDEVDGQSSGKNVVFGIAWDDANERDKPWKRFVTFGIVHMKLWFTASKKGGYKPSLLSFTGKGVKSGDVMSACFLPNDRLATGTREGRIYIWDADTRAVVHVLQDAHAEGVHIRDSTCLDGNPRPGGVRSLKMRRDGQTLLSGGADGCVMSWDVGRDGAPTLMHRSLLESQYQGEKPPCIKSIDCMPNGYSFMVGTHRCDVWEIDDPADTSSDAGPKVLVFGHESDLYGMAWHPVHTSHFATVEDSHLIFVWNARQRHLVKKKKISRPGRSLAYSPNGQHLACGTGPVLTSKGMRTVGAKLLVLEADTMKLLFEDERMKESIESLSYSPDGTRLAVGSRENYIDIYAVEYLPRGEDPSQYRGYRLVGRCSGHSSYITHLDWSKDGQLLQSNDGAYELLYWSAKTAKQVTKNQRDREWATQTCVLGFPVMGIWQDGSDGTDINSLCRSNAHPSGPIPGDQFVVTADDYGKVRFFNYPSVVEDGPHHCYFGHSSHVTGVRFSPEDRWVVSLGGHDRAVFQWVVDPVGREQIGVPKYRSDVEVVEVVPRAVDQSMPAAAGPGGVGPGGIGASDTPGAPGGPRAIEKQHPADAPGSRGGLGTADGGKAKADALLSVCQYTIRVKTSDLRGAGTDAAVRIKIYGSKSATTDFVLDSSKNDFERGQLDTFVKKGANVGDIERVVIQHDNSGLGSGWHLEYVEVDREAPAAHMHFPCKRWLAVDEDDGAICRTLFPNGPDGKPTRSARVYNVVVTTSDIRGAGTDADVFIQMFGKDGDSGRRRLDTSKNNFERGAVDKFSLEAYIGDVEDEPHIKHILIGHDNSGLAAGWHLNDVVISSQGMRPLTFEGKRWLDKDEGDHRTEVILFPLGKDGKPQGTLHTYEIVVYTSDVRGAGTDANVSIIMYGEQDSQNSGSIVLDNSKNNFERNMVDTFHHKSVDMGKISVIDIGHDNKGLGPGWHLRMVRVKNTNTGFEAAFPCNKWFDKGEGDKLIRRKLRANDALSGMVTYEVQVTTSDTRGAGTDANVYMILRGTKGGQGTESDKKKLDNSANNFERGRTDTFIIDLDDLGSLTHCVIGHDNGGLGPGWHLGSVKVKVSGGSENTREFYFPCDKWLDKREKDPDTGQSCPIERTLEVAKMDPNSAKSSYEVTVHTSDIRFAGTDANVSIQLMGDRGNTDNIKLASSKNDFERGSIDRFTLNNVKNVGDLQRIAIGHDDFGVGAAWHLKHVSVVCINQGRTLEFPVPAEEGWFDLSEYPNNIWRVLTPVGGDGSAAVQLIKYHIVTYTSDIRFAGSDSNVSCVLKGETGGKPIETTKMKLSSSKNNFERGRRDEFFVEASLVEKITSLGIGHDGSGVGDSWHLASVEVRNDSTGELTSFPCNAWLESKGKSRPWVELQPGAQNDAAKNKYRVTTFTSDIRFASTDADVKVVLKGDKGASQPLELSNSADNFERNRRDDFEVDAGLDLGDFKSATFELQKSWLPGSDWHLSHAEVVHIASGTVWGLFCGQWLNKKQPSLELLPGDQPDQPRAYEVKVYTSDIRGAGTDANVLLTIFGEAGDSGRIKLENSANNFERNTTDVFVVKPLEGKPPSLGKVTRVQIEHDNWGLGPAWHLNKVEVKDMASQALVVFPCDRWLDKSKDPTSVCQILVPEGDSAAELYGYNLIVYTGDERGAGTDANIDVQLHGTDKEGRPVSTGARKLDTSSNNFERGAVDRFDIQAVAMEEVVSVDIGHDNKFPFSDWMLEMVELHCENTGKHYHFPVPAADKWLKADHPQGCRRLLLPGKPSSHRKCKYRVTVATSDMRFAGTDADVTCVLYGKLGDSGERRLESSINNFERGSEDVFFVEAPDLGELTQLRIGHNNRLPGSDWHLGSVTVVNASSGDGTQYLFPFNNWLPTKDTKASYVTLTPDMDGDGVGDAVDPSARARYRVTVHTADDERFTGTGSKVTIALKGDKGAVGETVLENSRSNFSSGRVDVFDIPRDPKEYSTDVGALEYVVLSHDNKGGLLGSGDAWKVKLVEVENLTHGGRKFIFAPPGGRGLWLDEELGTLSSTLYEAESAKFKELDRAAGARSQWKISTFTADDFGAGTDGDVAITVEGTAVPEGGSAPEPRKWGPVKLSNARNNFERNKLDVFFLDPDKHAGLADVHELTRVEIGLTGKLWTIGDDWKLGYVTLANVTSKKEWTLTCGQWFNKKEGLVKVYDKATGESGLSLEGGGMGSEGRFRYRLAVATGKSWKGAGTDAHVFFRFKARGGEEWTPLVPQEKRHFEGGREDTFIVSRAEDFGEVEEVAVWHDGHGSFAGWLLAGVVLTNLVDEREWTFSVPKDCWIAGGDKGTVVLPAALTKEGVAPEEAARRAEEDAELRASVASAVGERSWDQVTGYTVEIQTGGALGAGTDSGILAELQHRRPSEEVGAWWQAALGSSSTNSDPFEKGKLDVFSVVAADDLGVISGLRLSSDGKGLGSDWQVDWVRVTNAATDEVWEFSCLDDKGKGRWVDLGKPVEVLSVTGSGPTDKTRAREKERAAAKSAASKPGAVASAAAPRAAAAPAAAAAQAQAQPAAAPAALPEPAASPTADTPYTFRFRTGTSLGAGTDANVTARIEGASGRWEQQFGRKEASAEHKDPFEKGAVDTFAGRVCERDLGELQALEVEHDGAGLGDSWQLASVEVVHEASGRTWLFTFQDDKGKPAWLYKKKAVQGTSPVATGGGRGGLGSLPAAPAAPAAQAAAPPPPPPPAASPWSEHSTVHPESGETISYFYNAVTGESSWVRPAEMGG